VHRIELRFLSLPRSSRVKSIHRSCPPRNALIEKIPLTARLIIVLSVNFSRIGFLKISETKLLFGPKRAYVVLDILFRIRLRDVLPTFFKPCC